jgi:hypothetical protein
MVPALLAAGVGFGVGVGVGIGAGVGIGVGVGVGIEVGAGVEVVVGIEVGVGFNVMPPSAGEPAGLDERGSGTAGAGPWPISTPRLLFPISPSHPAAATAKRPRIVTPASADLIRTSSSSTAVGSVWTCR